MPKIFTASHTLHKFNNFIKILLTASRDYHATGTDRQTDKNTT